MTLLPILGLGFVFVLSMSRKKKNSNNGNNGDSNTKQYSSQYTVSSGVIMSQWDIETMRKIIVYAPKNKDVIVTSGQRTYESQARAMQSKLYQYGEKSLYDTYKGKDEYINELINSPDNEWAGLLEEWNKDGIVFSYHLSGQALDIDYDEQDKYGGITKKEITLWAEQINKIEGLKAIIEENHMHVQKA